MAKKTTYYVLVVEGCVEPSLSDPFKSWLARDKEARRVCNEGVDNHGDTENNGVFWLDVTPDGKVEVGAYSNGFMEADEDEAARKRYDRRTQVRQERGSLPDGR
jgi:hypothetical protein